MGLEETPMPRKLTCGFAIGRMTGRQEHRYTIARGIIMEYGRGYPIIHFAA
jgi:hypothetical protein